MLRRHDDAIRRRPGHLGKVGPPQRHRQNDRGQIGEEHRHLGRKLHDDKKYENRRDRNERGDEHD